MAENMNALEIASRGLGECLKSNVLVVPKYQRAFSWGSENVLEFLTDINTAFTSGDSEYFMGSVVVQGEEQTYEVVDGQQRLTTASILVAAIRDILKDKSEADIATSLEHEFLVSTDTWKQNSKPRLTLSVYDNTFYINSILRTGGAQKESPSRESHERLQDAYHVSSKFLKEFIGQTSNWIERLRGFVDYLTHKVKVIVVAVPSSTNAYVVFETLNDRGKDLSASDLLKNYLFGKAAERIDEVQAKWNMMLGALEMHGGDEIVITYIRQLWSATREVAREKELFSKIKAQINSPASAVKFADELQKFSRTYAAIFNADDAFWKELPPDAARIMRSLHILKVERYRPAMLAVLCNFSGKELVGAMRLILNGSVRYMVAIGAGGGTLEAAYSEAARKIFNKELVTAAAFAKEMQKIIPNDETFRTSFKAARLSKAFLARYFLIALERAERGEENCELVPNDEAASVNLEHILPENPQGNWPGIPDEMASAYSRRIGNMALLAASKNNELGNEPFATKRPVLAASAFLLTKMAAVPEQWGPEEIDARQAKLADTAVGVWSYKSGS